MAYHAGEEVVTEAAKVQVGVALPQWRRSIALLLVPKEAKKARLWKNSLILPCGQSQDEVEETGP